MATCHSSSRHWHQPAASPAWPNKRLAENAAFVGVFSVAQHLPGRPVLARTVHGLDAGKDEIDAGEELLAVVVFAQLCCGFVHGWVPGEVELRPLCGDGG